MRATILAALATAALLTGTARAGEPVTPEMWHEAQAEAARLSGGTLSLSNARPTQIVSLPIEELCELFGRCPHAAAYGSDVAWFRDDRPWASDRGHHFGIVIHEAAHSLQSRVMSRACREVQAHAIQVAWLLERGEVDRLDAVAGNAGHYDCSPENAPIRRAS